MPDRDLQPTECLMTIAGTGSYVPERVLTNADLEKMVDTSDEWITTRTGIKERRIAAKGENTSDMASAAALRAMEMARVSASEIELIIVATVTPDTIFPSTACYVQRNLGASNAVAFDISAACSGFLYAMQISRHFINTGNRKTALIIGAEKLSSIVNWSDRNTCVLFGDGAGAAILRRRSTDEAVHEPRVLVTVMGTDGTLTDILNVPGGGSAIPITVENAHLNLNTVHMRGQETFKVAVTQVSAACARALELAGLRPTDIDVIVPHQANVRIIDAAAERLGIPKKRAFTNIQKFGNTSAASCAIALDECHRTGVIKPGNYVLIVAFGAGFTWAASVVKW
jgi:3-oxoacyl-[acyl-carrier-protein] synthase-3